MTAFWNGAFYPDDDDDWWDAPEEKCPTCGFPPPPHTHFCEDCGQCADCCLCDLLDDYEDES